MSARRLLLLLVLALVIVVGVRRVRGSDASDLVLTGIVTTDDVIVSPLWRWATSSLPHGARR